MSNTVDRIGTFRFDKVLEAGVGAKYDEGNKTIKNVSFNIRLHISEFYDELEGQWVDWSEYDVEIPAYLYLFGIDKKTKKFGPIFHHQQVTKVFGWDGKSFQILANDDYSKIKGQIRIADNDPEYAEKNPFQVANIDVFDADPSSQLRSLSASGLKELDAKFAQVLQSTGQAPKAVTVPTKKTTRPVPPTTTAKAKTETAPLEDTAEVEQKPETAAERKAKIKEKAKRLKKEAKKKDPPTRPTTPPSAVPQEGMAMDGVFTKQQAWEFVVEMKNDDCDDEQLQASWGGAVNQIAGAETLDEDVTGEQWHQIANTVIDEVGKF